LAEKEVPVDGNEFIGRWVRGRGGRGSSWVHGSRGRPRGALLLARTVSKPDRTRGRAQVERGALTNSGTRLGRGTGAGVLCHHPTSGSI